MRRRIATGAAIVVGRLVVAPAALAATATPFGGATTLGRHPEPRLRTSETSSATERRLRGLVLRDGRHDVRRASRPCRRSSTSRTTIAPGGSPRFQIRVQTPSGEKNVFVYLGPDAVVRGVLAERVDRLRAT